MLYTIQRLLRLFVPVGLIELLQARDNFARIPFASASPWQGALSRRLRGLLLYSRLDIVPRAFLTPPVTIVDVGANVGHWSEAVMTLVAPQRVIAVEPDPAAFRELQARLGGRPGVQLFQCAIGGEQGTTTFNVWENSEWNSMLPLRSQVQQYYRPVEGHRSITVELTTLDTLLADVPKINLLKVDVQGGEMALLDGARQTLQRTQCLLIENNFVSHYEGDALFDVLHERLTKEFGFYLHRWARPGYSRSDGDGRLLTADAVYVRPHAEPAPERK